MFKVVNSRKEFCVFLLPKITRIYEKKIFSEFWTVVPKHLFIGNANCFNSEICENWIC